MFVRLIFSVICFTFILVSNISTSYAFMSTEKVVFIDDWTIKVYKKAPDTKEYKLMYFGHADDKDAEEKDNVVIYPDRSSKKCFSIIDKKNNHYVLEILGMNLRGEQYSNKFDFDIENPETFTETNSVVVFDNKNNIKIIIKQNLGYKNNILNTSH